MKKKSVTVVTGAAVVGIAAGALANASVLKNLFEPGKFQKFEKQDANEDYDYVSGDGEDLDLADQDNDSQGDGGEENQQYLKQTDTWSELQNDESGNAPGLGLANLSQGDQTGNVNGNAILFTDDPENASVGVADGSGIIKTDTSGTGETTTGGSTGENDANSSTKEDDNKTEDDRNDNNNGDSNGKGDTDDPKEPEESWEDGQLKKQDPVETEDGQLLGITAEITKDHYVLTEKFQAQDATVTATYLKKDGTKTTKELSYGGTNGYHVSLATEKTGTQMATFPGMPLKDEDGYADVRKLVQTPANCPKDGDLIDLTSVHSKMIAFLGDEQIASTFAGSTEDTRITFAGSTVPKISGKTELKGTVIVPDSEKDLVRKCYQLAFGTENEQIEFVTETHKTADYVYDETNQRPVLRSKEDPGILMGIPTDTAGYYQIDDTITGIGAYAFYGCKNLTDIEVGESVTQLQENSLVLEENLSIIQLTGETLPELGDTIFGETMPPFVHLWVKENQVDECKGAYREKLDAAYGEETADTIIEQTNEKIEYIRGVEFEWTEEGRVLKKAAKELSGSYVVPENTVAIATDAFRDCQNLTQIEIPTAANIRLGDRCFKGCQELQKVMINGMITEWGEETFMDCTGISKLQIGAPNATQAKQIDKIGDWRL